jgi:hypothetical protein
MDAAAHNKKTPGARADRLWMVGAGVIHGLIHGPLPNKSNAKRIGKIRGRWMLFQDETVRDYIEQFETAVWSSLGKIEPLPPDAKLYFKATVHQQNMLRDLDCELLPDLLQRFNLIANDRAIWRKEYERRLDKENPRVEFELGPWRLPGEVDLFDSTREGDR